jgi:hypothetical protein
MERLIHANTSREAWFRPSFWQMGKKNIGAIQLTIGLNGAKL